MRSGVVILESFNKFYSVMGETGDDPVSWIVGYYRKRENAEASVSKFNINASENKIPLSRNAFCRDYVDVDKLIDIDLKYHYYGYGVEYRIIEIDLSD